MWSAVMSKIHNGLEPKEFEVSSYATERYYCTSTGLLATSACPSKSIGWYKKSNTPGSCTTHAGAALKTPAEIKKAEEEKKAAESSKAESTSSSSSTSSASSTSSKTESNR